MILTSRKLHNSKKITVETMLDVGLMSNIVREEDDPSMFSARYEGSYPLNDILSDITCVVYTTPYNVYMEVVGFIRENTEFFSLNDDVDELAEFHVSMTDSERTNLLLALLRAEAPEK